MTVPHVRILKRAAACLLCGTLAAGWPLEVLAQTCPPGYYYASDGNCYQGPPPSYPPPAYETVPPVSPPPAVTDGLMIGLGLLLGGLLVGGHPEHRGRPEAHRPPPRRYEPNWRRYDQRDRERH